MIKKINAFLFVLSLVLASLAAFQRYGAYARPAGGSASGAAEKKAVESLCASAAGVFGRFFAEADRVVFFSGVERFAGSRGLKFLAGGHHSSPRTDLSVLNVNKVVFNISVSGRYADIRSFIFMLENGPSLNSIDYLRLFASPAGGEASAEIRYSLYSFASLKKVRPGERSAINDYKPLYRHTGKTSSAGREAPVDIFASVPPAPAPVQAPPVPAPVKKPAGETRPVELSSAASDTARMTKPASGGRIKYCGFYLDSKKGIRAFIEFDGRVRVVRTGDPLGESYTVAHLDGSRAVIANREEPFDTIEATLDKSSTE